MTVWVLREPTQNVELDWFSIGKPLFEYEQQELVPCSFWNDSQNREFMYVKYISRSELLTGNYRFYTELDALVSNVTYEFNQTI